MPSLCIGAATAAGRGVVDIEAVPGTSSIFQDSLSKAGGSNIKSTDTSSDDATVDGVPNADKGSLLLLVAA